MRTGVSCTLLFLLLTGVAFAQSAARTKRSQSSLHERLFYSSNERMQWEAAQTWNSPAIPNTAGEPAHPSIHLEQPPLTPPRIRREWLRPSLEAGAGDATTGIADILNLNGSAAYLPKKAQ
jgi:hypothetical protein